MLNSLNPSLAYIFSISANLRSWILLGYISYIAIGAGNLSGSIKFLKDIGNDVSECIHLSDITFTKYYGGIGSCNLTVNDKE